MKRSLFCLSGAFLLSTGLCLAQHRLQNGIWRGVLKTPDQQDLPFNFEVKEVAGKQQLNIINGAERFNVPDVHTAGDSVFIKMPLFDSEFKLKLQNGALQGTWIKHLADRDNVTAFNATPATNWRFLKMPQQAAYNITGRWLAPFISGGKRDVTVGEFKQNGNKVTGTFLTTTGDYRYLEGTLSGKSLYLSCFDGGHAFLFTATMANGHTIVNGKFGTDTWTAVKDANAKLPDAYTLTSMKPGYNKVTFRFKDLDGRIVSLSDARFKNKVVILQVMGSWCPNCMDETSYLVNYYKKYHPRGVEVIGLAYERTTAFARSKRTLLQLKKRFNVPYPLLITGYTNSRGEPAKSLPMLANFVAFPTTIIINKKGEVAKIHTGYSGPGTGNHYTEFVKEFEKLTDNLLAGR